MPRCLSVSASVEKLGRDAALTTLSKASRTAFSAAGAADCAAIVVTAWVIAATRLGGSCKSGNVGVSADTDAPSMTKERTLAQGRLRVKL